MSNNTLTAKIVVDNKFWIVEQAGTRVGTIRTNSENGEVIISGPKFGDRHFINFTELKKSFDINIEASSAASRSSKVVDTSDVYGYPTKQVAYNKLMDVQQRIPIYTKQEKSRSYFCAGYYTVEFDRAWVPSFCPKLITLRRNNFKGPFKTELEMQEQLRLLRNAASKLV